MKLPRNRFSSAVNGDRQTAIPRRSFLFCFVLTRGEDSLLTSVYHCQTTRRAHAPRGVMGIAVSHVIGRAPREPGSRKKTEHAICYIIVSKGVCVCERVLAGAKWFCHFLDFYEAGEDP